ncbi:TPA: DUF2591 family protein [Escherichia coli]|nr:DUF2591 domain-containing protein [Escherichia coli]EHG7564063.1 DUF2591 domain-containing protein [Escherichia fergusonii]EFH3683181.1 DUF2591 domain-containing protein [Escherichia coli]EFN4507296.1 DUF2591 domain-containing protein [Escherichia coli]HAI7532585.1 DUF2591 domain-containing protein [Escherichia coli]
MDYSQLSDFEINKRVAICCGFAPEDCEIAKLGTSIVGVEWDDETGYAIKTVDYCKSPSDAYPIITENKISTMWMTAEKEWCAWSGGDLEEGCWVPDYCFCGESPLRAAMIVFLMIQDANNA